MAQNSTLEFRIDEANVQSAWLETLYELADELNCKCQTFFEEKYYTARKCFAQTRIVRIKGSNSMLAWLKLRIERYNHFINSLNYYAEFYSTNIDNIGENKDSA